MLTMRAKQSCFACADGDDGAAFDGRSGNRRRIHAGERRNDAGATKADRRNYPTLTPHVFAPGRWKELIVGERGRVADGRWQVAESGGAGHRSESWSRQMAPLDDFKVVLAGARCAGSILTWFQVDYRGIPVRWAGSPRADGQYFAEPWLPG